MHDLANHTAVGPPPGVPQATTAQPPSARVLEELRHQFEAAVDFADLCSFLSGGSSGERASQLVDVAQALLTETVDVLGTQVARGPDGHTRLVAPGRGFVTAT